MAVPEPVRESIMAAKSERADVDEPLHEDSREVEMNRNSPKCNLTTFARDLHDLDGDSTVQVRVFVDRIEIRPLEGD